MTAIAGERTAQLSSEEIAADLWRRRQLSGGVRFARAQERPAKDQARREVVRAMTPCHFPALSVFVMPGLEWKFERQLLAVREAKALRKNKKGTGRTYICGIESDEAVFRASMKWMPGATQWADKGIAVLPSIECATASVRTPLVQRYHRCTFEDYAELVLPPERYERQHKFDAAWLDFNGQLTERRIAAIERFWTTSIRSLLVVTGLNARTDAATTARIQEYGNAARFLERLCAGSRAVRSITYCDTTPMFQVTLARLTPIARPERIGPSGAEARKRHRARIQALAAGGAAPDGGSGK